MTYTELNWENGSMRLLKASMEHMEAGIFSNGHRKTELYGHYCRVAQLAHVQGSQDNDFFMQIPFDTVVYGGSHYNNGVVTIDKDGYYLISAVVSARAPDNIVSARICAPGGRMGGPIYACRQARTINNTLSDVKTTVCHQGYFHQGDQFVLQAKCFGGLDYRWYQAQPAFYNPQWATNMVVFLLGDGPSGVAGDPYESDYEQRTWVKGESTNLSKFQHMEDGIAARVHPATVPVACVKGLGVTGQGTNNLRNIVCDEYGFYNAIFDGLATIGAKTLSTTQMSVIIPSAGYYLVSWQMLLYADVNGARGYAELWGAHKPVTPLEITMGQQYHDIISSHSLVVDGQIQGRTMPLGGTVVVYLNQSDYIGIRGYIYGQSGEDMYREEADSTYLNVVKLT